MPGPLLRLVQAMQDIDQVLLMKFIQKQQTAVSFKDLQLAALLHFRLKVDLKVIK